MITPGITQVNSLHVTKCVHLLSYRALDEKNDTIKDKPAGV